MGLINAVIADENNLFSAGMQSLLQGAFPSITITSIATSFDELEYEVISKAPELIIMNIKLPGRLGIDCISQIKKKTNGCKVLVVTEYDQTKFVKEAFKHGADGYILKSAQLEELSNAVNSVLSGATFMGIGVSTGPLRRKPKLDYHIDWSREDAFLLKENLTKREVEVLSCIADEKNNKEIARELYISDQTVSVHRKNIMKKLNVNTTANLIKKAAEYQLLV